MSGALVLTEEEEQAITQALPAIRRTSPEAAKLIRRLVRAYRNGKVVDASTYAPIAEVAATFGVTDQTIRNWVDRGWLPSQRTVTGRRKIPRTVLASAQALRRTRPASPDLSAEQIEAIINAPRRARR